MKAGPAPQITLRWLLTRWKRQRGYCPIFRVKMAMKGPLGATIDQIEPGKGYTRRNTQLVTHCGNGFKGGMTMRETRQLRRQILGVLAALLLLVAIDPAAAQTPRRLERARSVHRLWPRPPGLRRAAELQGAARHVRPTARRDHGRTLRARPARPQRRAQRLADDHVRQPRHR
jgi:hypothetical protein